jgi:rifampicin phosphotransferase
MSTPSGHVLRLDQCEPEQSSRVGGKALGLGHLLRQSRDVPPGFVVTTDAYRQWLASRSLHQVVERLIQGATDVAKQEAASREIRAIFAEAALPDGLAAEIGLAYAQLSEQEVAPSPPLAPAGHLPREGGGSGEAPVAVRSSATAEDTADASFAGQQETYLGVRGLASVLEHVASCWASLFTPQAISYRERLGVPIAEVAMAVLVQRMVDAAAAGVMLTIDPVTGDRSQITIEAAFGLGAPVVGGEITPDRYSVDKVTLEIRSREITSQPFADRLDPSTGSVERVELSAEEGGASSLTDDEVVRIAEVGKHTERALGGPVDVEWAVGPGRDGPRHLYLLQARPETVWSGRQAAPIAQPETTPMDRIVSLMLGGRNRK